MIENNFVDRPFRLPQSKYVQNNESNEPLELNTCDQVLINALDMNSADPRLLSWPFVLLQRLREIKIAAKTVLVRNNH